MIADLFMIDTVTCPAAVSLLVLDRETGDSLLSAASLATRLTHRSSTDTDGARPARHWPRSFSALAVRNYRLYLSTQIVATTGLWMQRIAQDWLILELTGKVSAVGIAVALQFAPVLIFGLFGGLIADRFPKRRILMITQSTAALMAATLGVLALTHTVQAWHVFAIALVLGFVTVVDNPTRQVFVSELVGSHHIRNAVSLNSSVFQFGALLGPALSGILISAVGQGWSFLINSAACAGVVTMLAIIDAPVPARVSKAGTTVARQFKEGLQYIRHTSEVAWTIALVAVIGLFGLNMPVILAAFANTEFKVGVGGYSVFNSLTAVGALMGALISARRTEKLRLRALVTCLTALGLVLTAAAVIPVMWLFAAGLVGVGLTTLLFLTGANSLVQMTAGPDVRGRVMSVYLLVLLGGQAVGGPVVGALIDHAGPRLGMAACGTAVAVTALVAGLAMARHAHLRLRHQRGRLVPRIVHS